MTSIKVQNKIFDSTIFLTTYSYFDFALKGKNTHEIARPKFSHVRDENPTINLFAHS